MSWILKTLGSCYVPSCSTGHEFCQMVDSVFARPRKIRVQQAIKLSTFWFGFVLNPIGYEFNEVSNLLFLSCILSLIEQKSSELQDLSLLGRLACEAQLNMNLTNFSTIQSWTWLCQVKLNMGTIYSMLLSSDMCKTQVHMSLTLCNI